MSAWSNADDIQTWIWTSLVGEPLKQISATFNNSGTIQMQALQYWNDLDSPDMQQTKAGAMATTIDAALVGQFGATYKAGVTSTSAITAMQGIISTKDKTINDLTDIAELNYQS